MKPRLAPSMMKVLALIPAKGCSKGLPQKNIRLLGGKPLIAWTIEAARQSRVLDRIIVSTDDRAIADLAKIYQAEVPFMRPESLATDAAILSDVVLHALDDCAERENYHPEFVMLLQPTSPLRTDGDIVAACRLFQEHEARALISVTEVQKYPRIMVRLRTDGRIEPFLPVLGQPTTRQAQTVLHLHNGAIYLIEVETFRRVRAFEVEGDTVGYVMPAERSVDIDTETDFLLADTLLNRRTAKAGNPRGTIL